MAIEDKDTATDLSVAPVVGPDDPRRFTDSGIEVKTLYTSEDLPEDLDLGKPGRVPVHARRARARCTASARGRCASTRATRRRRSPTSATSTCSRTAPPGLSMAFDLPTQLGLDSDDPRSLGEVGRTGVAIDTLDDMRTAFDGIPLDEVSHLDDDQRARRGAAAALRAGRRGAGRRVPAAQAAPSRTTSSRSTSRAGTSSTRPSRRMRLTTDLFAYCKENIPKWNTVSISGYHFREKGASRRPGGRVHARERHGVRAGGDRRRPAGRRLRAAPGLLLQRPQQRLPGGREVPRRPQHVGARDGGPLRRQGPEVA